MLNSVVDEQRRLLSVPLGISRDSKLFIVLLAAVVMLPSLSIDSCLASLTNIGVSLHGKPAATGAILSLFMVGFALGQSLFGPLCDRLGRRPALLVGCAIFTVAAFGCATSASMSNLIFWRFVQGIGASAGPVISFAIVRDLFCGKAARRRFAYVGAIATLAPIIAPTLGGLIAGYAGWRGVFCALAIGGVLLGAIIILCLEESIARRDAGALLLKSLGSNYWRVISNRLCRTYVVIGGLSFGSLFAYVSGSAFVFIQIFKLNQQLFGELFALNASCIALGALATGRFCNIPPKQMIGGGLMLGLIASGTLVLLTCRHILTPVSAMPFLMLNTFSVGVVTPNVVHGTLEPVPEIAGVASSFFGAIRMIGGAVSSQLVALCFNGTPLAMTGIMLLFASVACGFYLLSLPLLSKAALLNPSPAETALH